MKYFYVAAFLLILSTPLVIKAQGNLLIIPRRVVFEGAKRSQEINLSNIGIDTAHFTASLIQYRMEKDGRFTELAVPDSGQNFATKFVRFFPREVNLGPNEAQVIKMQLVNTAQLQPGEYRSHLYFRAVPKMGVSPTDKKDTAAIKGEISIKLVAQYGISIPVIIRVGPSTTVTTLNNAFVHYQDGKPVLQMDINRTGNMSVYGDIKINYVGEDGSISPIGNVKGLSVYTPNLVRTVNIALEPKNQNLHKGKLHVIFLAPPDVKAVTFAETDVLLK